MPGATTNLALPYPLSTEAPDGPGAVLALAQKIDDMATASGAIDYAGTMHDWGPGSGWAQALRRSLGVVSLIAAVDPGGNGVGTGSTNSLMASIPAGFRPVRNLIIECPIYTGTWNGARAQIQIGTDGRMVCNYLSQAMIFTDGWFIAVSATYPAA